MLRSLRNAIVILPLVVCSVSISNRAFADSELINVTANGMTCDVPAGWTVAPAGTKADAEAAAKLVATALCDHIATLHNIRNDRPGLRDFHMALMPEGHGFFAAYTIDIPQDRSYYSHVMAYNAAEMASATSQRAGIKLNKNESVWIDELRYLKTDMTYAAGARVVQMDRWFGDDPDRVGRILFTFAPSATAADRQAMEAALASLQAEEYRVTNNATIGPLTMYVPGDWKELESIASGAARTTMAPSILADFADHAVDGEAAPAIHDFKAYENSEGATILAYTITLPQQGDYLGELHAAQSGKLDQFRAKMTSVECRRGLINGVDVVRLAGVDASGGSITTIQQWDAAQPTRVTVVTVRALASAPAATAAEATRIVRSIAWKK